MKKKVICAISGGVDSSVSAALLKKAGFDVIGIFMRFWEEKDVSHWHRCCSLEAETRARMVAKILKIPFYTFNFSKEFKERVINFFLKGYHEGITPNPCIVCNKEIKFGLLLEKSLSLGGDYLATGHYARTDLNRFRLKEIAGRKNDDWKRKKVRLLQGKDKEKDQSYFLWQLNQEQLRHILFPVGNYKKSQIRNLAKKFKLPVLTVSESMELCFIKTKIYDFLKSHLKQKPGKIVDLEGKVIGQHQGLWFYTIGQRKGICLPGGPYYVFDKEVKKNLLFVTKKENDLYKKKLIAKEVNWISGQEPKLPLIVEAKIRYRQLTAKALLSNALGSQVYSLKFQTPQRAITPGQSVVFYRGEEVLGGGIIC